MQIKLTIKNLAKILFWKLSRHINDPNQKDTIIFTSRRGGGTWLTELISSLPKMRKVIEPLENSLHNKFIKLDLYLSDDMINNGSISLNNKHDKEVIMLLNDIKIGKYYYMAETRLWRKDYYFVTNRSVIKTHVLKHKIFDLRKYFVEDVFIYQIRHPISQSFSAMRYKSVIWAERYLQSSDILKIMPEHAIRLWYDNLKMTDNHYLKYVYDWCIENIIPLKNIIKMQESNILFFPYEIMVIEPMIVCKSFENIYSVAEGYFDNIIYRPSKTTDKKEPIKINKNDQSNKLDVYLLKLNENEKSNVQKILDTFEIDFYNAYQSLPNKKYSKLWK